MSHEERVARALLSRLAEPADRRLSRLLAAMPATELVALIRSGSARVPAVERYAARLAAAEPEADLARAAEVGGRLLVPGDLEWPSQLDDLGDTAPWALWVRGTTDLRMSALRSVAVVGSRAATRYGVDVASTVGSDLALLGWTVVSGGAFGIDAAAHLGALAAGGTTVAALACGVDVAYPPRHDALFARIAADGLLVSEVPPGAAPHRTRFLDRKAKEKNARAFYPQIENPIDFLGVHPRAAQLAQIAASPEIDGIVDLLDSSERERVVALWHDALADEHL